MSNKGPTRTRIGCVLQVIATLMVLAVLGCAGAIGGLWWGFFYGIYEPPPAPDRPLVLRGGTVFDGEKVRTGVLVLIEGDRVVCAGKDCGVPAHAEVLEGKGLFFTPGWVDLHIHMGAPTGDDLSRSIPSLMWSTLRHRPGVRRALLESGVTTVRSVGDDLMSTRNQQIWLEDGTIGGPRLIGAGPVFTAPGGHPADKLLAEAPWMVDGSTRQSDDPDRARTQAIALLDQGMAGVKLVYDDVSGTLPKLDLAVLKAVAEEARGRDAWVAVHTGTDQDVLDALDAGATTIEHGARDALSDASIAALLEADATYVPTLAVIEALLPSILDQAKANALKAHAAGVRIGVGSDTQGPDMAFGPSTAREVQLLIEAGLDPVAALSAATTAGGQALGRPELGALRAGAMADLVGFYGDPTTDKTAVDRPVLVLQSGRIAVDRR